MGTSTDAILFYGFLFDGENFIIETGNEELDAKLNEENDDGIEDIWNKIIYEERGLTEPESDGKE